MMQIQLKEEHNTTNLKLCPTCKTAKSRDEFGPNRSKRDGLASLCRYCANAATKRYQARNKTITKERSRLWNRQHKEVGQDSRLRREYGISLATYKALVQQQNNQCAICKQVPYDNKLHIDHNHKTGVIRELLCGLCNRALGLLRDNPLLLDAAATYLRKHELAAERAKLVNCNYKEVT